MLFRLKLYSIFLRCDGKLLKGQQPSHPLNHSCVVDIVFISVKAAGASKGIMFDEEKQVLYTGRFSFYTGGNSVTSVSPGAMVISSETYCCFQRTLLMSDVQANQTSLYHEK